MYINTLKDRKRDFSYILKNFFFKKLTGSYENILLLLDYFDMHRKELYTVDVPPHRSSEIDAEASNKKPHGLSEFDRRSRI